MENVYAVASPEANVTVVVALPGEAYANPLSAIDGFVPVRIVVLAPAVFAPTLLLMYITSQSLFSNVVMFPFTVVTAVTLTVDDALAIVAGFTPE